jgi:hypothetical protein
MGPGKSVRYYSANFCRGQSIKCYAKVLCALATNIFINVYKSLIYFFGRKQVQHFFHL